MILALLLAALQDPAAPQSARAAQRLELRREVAKTNGAWKLHEWGHYFVVTDVEDASFLEELERRAFEARELCSRLFPEAQSDPVRDDRRLVILRVANSQAEYLSYGGPAGSTGYWSVPAGEIVIHDDTDRGPTWEALAGCVARAFADEVFGNSPRSAWFEDGLGELAASQIPSGRSWRETQLRELSNRPWPSLDQLLSNELAGDFSTSRIACWTWMRFLADPERQGPNFDPRWAGIPERYAVGWVAHSQEAKARAFAFEGVDLAALEHAWRASLRP